MSCFYNRNFKPLTGFAGRFESDLVGNPEDRISCDVAQIILNKMEYVYQNIQTSTLV